TTMEDYPPAETLREQNISGVVVYRRPFPTGEDLIYGKPTRAGNVDLDAVLYQLHQAGYPIFAATSDFATVPVQARGRWLKRAMLRLEVAGLHPDSKGSYGAVVAASGPHRERP